MFVLKFAKICCSRHCGSVHGCMAERLCSSLPPISIHIVNVPVSPGFVAMSDKNEENMPVHL